MWRPTLTREGKYVVYYRLPDGASDRAPAALFTVRHACCSTYVTRSTSLTWRHMESSRHIPVSFGYVEHCGADGSGEWNIVNW